VRRLPGAPLARHNRPFERVTVTILGPVLRGAVAGAIGTVAMDLLWYSRYRRGGGASPFSEWEFTREVRSWEDAPAPGQVGRKIIEAVSGDDVPVERAPALSNVMHWAYGVSWTVAYGVLARALNPRRPLWHGPAFGAAVWSSDYVALPLAGVYKPIWKYDARTLYEDLSAHVVFGTAGDAALRLLPGR
jgi:hypothetical protein